MAGSNNEDIVYVKDGKRLDGRAVDELRPVKVKLGVIERADGSSYVEWGQNKIIASVYGPKEALPKHISNPYKAIVRFTYRMAPFSVPDRKNPRPGRREVEISKVLGEAVERAVFLERFPRTMINVDVQILDSNAGSRIAALTAASLALADAGIPMKGLIAGATVGKAGGNLIIDLTKAEEDAPDAVDLAIATVPTLDEIVLMQMDGHLSQEEYPKVMELAKKGLAQIVEIQEKALKEQYKESD